jgi:hypothetical protein
LFVLIAWSSNVFERTLIDQKSAVIKKLDVYDRYFQIAAIAIILIVSTRAWLQTRLRFIGSATTMRPIIFLGLLKLSRSPLWQAFQHKTTISNAPPSK